jgi:hypothetical protein
MREDVVGDADLFGGDETAELLLEAFELFWFELIYEIGSLFVEKLIDYFD